MFNVKLTILFAVVTVLSVLAEFPEDSKPCSYGDSECLVKTINDILHKPQGDESIDLIPLDPLNISKLSIAHIGNYLVNIDLTFTNVEVTGLSKCEVVSVSGFDKDPTGPHEIRAVCAQFILSADYSIDGHVLYVPMQGQGETRVVSTKCDVVFAFNGDTYEKDGETYFKATDSDIRFNPKNVQYKFKNLFNGNRYFDKLVNGILNKHWNIVYNDLDDTMAMSFGELYEGFMNRVFAKYPHNKYLVD